jgi:hypothetical protein
MSNDIEIARFGIDEMVTVLNGDTHEPLCSGRVVGIQFYSDAELAHAIVGQWLGSINLHETIQVMNPLCIYTVKESEKGNYIVTFPWLLLSDLGMRNNLETMQCLGSA